MKSFQTQTHYEVLEISVGATETEVRSAYQRLSLLYSDDQVVLYGLIDPARATALRNRLQEALEVLTDDQRRDAYDVKIGLPPRLVVPSPATSGPRPSAPGTAAGASAGTGWGTFSWVTPSGPEHTPTQPSAYTYAVAPPKPVAPAPLPAKTAPIPPPVKSAPVPEPIAPIEPPDQTGPVPSELILVEVPVPEPVVAPAEPSPEPPRQLALDVSSGGAGWGARAAPTPLTAPEPELESVEGAGPEVLAELEPMPVAAASAPVMMEQVLQAAPPVMAPPPRASVPEVLVPGGQPLAPQPLPEPPAPDQAVAPVEAPAVPVLGDDVQVAIIPARASPSREFRVEQRPRPYEVPEGVEINGDLLRQVRMARGLSLVQVADRTRIGVKHLENVEADRYDALPAAVYLRGILMNLARELGLDGLRVSRSYLTFVEAHRSKG